MSKYTILIYDGKNPRSFTYNLAKYFNLVLLSGNQLNALNTLQNKIDFLSKIINHYKIRLVHFHEISFENALALYIVSKRKAKIPLIATLHTYKLICPILFYVIHPELKPCKSPYPSIQCVKCVSSYIKMKSTTNKKAKHVRLFSSLMLLNVYRKIYKNVDVVIVPSNTLADILLHKLNFKNILVLHNPLKSPFEPYRHINVGEQPSQVINIGFIGRLEYLKGINIVLSMVKRLPRLIRFNRNVNVYIAGDGSYRRLVKRYSMIIPNVKYLGYLTGKKLVDFYMKAHLILVPSLTHECFPNVVLESLVMEKPVVGFALGGVKEIIEKSQGGLLAKPFDLEDFMNKVSTLIVNDELRHKLSLKGKRWIKNNIPTYRSYSSLLASIYKKVLT